MGTRLIFTCSMSVAHLSDIISAACLDKVVGHQKLNMKINKCRKNNRAELMNEWTRTSWNLIKFLRFYGHSPAWQHLKKVICGGFVRYSVLYMFFLPNFRTSCAADEIKNKRQRTIIDNEYNFRCLIDKLNKFNNFFTAMISFDMIFKIVLLPPVNAFM